MLSFFGFERNTLALIFIFIFISIVYGIYAYIHSSRTRSYHYGNARNVAIDETTALESGRESLGEERSVTRVAPGTTINEGVWRTKNPILVDTEGQKKKPARPKARLRPKLTHHKPNRRGDVFEQCIRNAHDASLSDEEDTFIYIPDSEDRCGRRRRWSEERVDVNLGSMGTKGIRIVREDSDVIVGVGEEQG
jgi:hypothetical protein